MEAAQLRPALHGGERLPRPLQVFPVHVVGEEGALAQHVRMRVQHLVDAVESEVRHPDEIEVRIAQRDAEASGLLDGLERDFSFPVSAVAFVQWTRHGQQTILARFALGLEPGA